MIADCQQCEQRQPSAAANLVAFGVRAKFGGVGKFVQKNLVRGVRTISLQAKALPGTLILRTLIIRPPMILEPMISTLTISAHLVSTHIVSTLTIARARSGGYRCPP